MHVIATAALAVGTGVVTIVLAAPVLRRLPAPTTEADPVGPADTEHPGPAEHPVSRARPAPAPGGSPVEGSSAGVDVPRFADLVRPRFLLLVGLVALTVAGVAVATLPPVLWAPWLVLAVGGSLLGCIDGATTWLPNHLMYPTWAAMGLALLVVGFLAGPGVALRLLGCALGWGVVFYVAWLLARGRLGFGDVRLAVLLGAGSGAAGWIGSYLCLLAATVLGALWGLAITLVRAVRSRSREPGTARGFAYGLPLFLGCTAGLGLTTLFTG